MSMHRYHGSSKFRLPCHHRLVLEPIVAQQNVTLNCFHEKAKIESILTARIKVRPVSTYQ